MRKCAEESIPACKGRISGGDDKQRGGTQNESRLVCTRNSACESNIPQLDTKYRCREISRSVTQNTDENKLTKHTIPLLPGHTLSLARSSRSINNPSICFHVGP